MKIAVVFAALLATCVFAQDDAAGDQDDGVDYVDDTKLTKDDRAAECREKLQITNDLYMEGSSFGETADILAKANGDGYPDNSLGYVWCSRYVGGLEAAKADPLSIELVVAPYLEKLPATTKEVDELAGNTLESDALKAQIDQYNPDDFTSPEDYNDTSKSEKESEYAWSGAASLEGKAPSVGEGEAKPMKTSLARLMMNPADTSGDVFTCACGIWTTDMSAETGSGIDDAGADEGQEGSGEDGGMGDDMGMDQGMDMESDGEDDMASMDDGGEAATGSGKDLPAEATEQADEQGNDETEQADEQASGPSTALAGVGGIDQDSIQNALASAQDALPDNVKNLIGKLGGAANGDAGGNRKLLLL